MTTNYKNSMNLVNEIFNSVLNKIKPTKQDLVLIDNIIEKLKKLLYTKANELNIEYTQIETQGSTGIKQTQLRDNFDIDLFIGLNYALYKPKYEGLSKNKLKKLSKKDFLELCNKWLISALNQTEFNNPRLLYAEHPYLTVDYHINNIKIKIDIVLYFDLDLDYINHYGPITAVDRSPWHGRFVKDHLNQKQKDDVRLLKQFFKACHCYGDKSAVGKMGFIGYSAELLIYHFGDLLTLFKNFNSLKNNPLDYYKRSITDLRKIKHFANDILFIIDPIDMNRNVASAISERAYNYCNYQIAKFLEQPDEKFFIIIPIPEINKTQLNDPILSKVFIAEFKNKDNEIHYTIIRDKLYSLGDSIKKNGENEYSHTERFGKIIFEVYFEDKIEEYNLAIYCEKVNISSHYTRKGPSIKDKNHADKFKTKNRDYFIQNGYLWIKTQREFSDFFQFLHNFLIHKSPPNLELINLSKSFECKTRSGKRAIYVLKNMVLPFYL